MQYIVPPQPSLATPHPDLFGYPPQVTAPPATAPPVIHVGSVPAPRKKNVPRPRTAATSADDLDSQSGGPIGLQDCSDDSLDTFIAKRMFRMLLDDLSGASHAEPDVFGQRCGTRDWRRYDALIWLYNLNPDGAAVPFDWVCDEIGLDPEAVRRISARNLREELRQVLQLIALMVGSSYASACEIDLMEYVSLEGWSHL